MSLYDLRRLEAPIISRPGDDHAAYLLQDFLTLGEWQAVEIVWQMPCKPPFFCSADVAATSCPEADLDRCSNFPLKYPLGRQ